MSMQNKLPQHHDYHDTKSYGFPRYDREELLADRSVHLIGTPLALGGVTWLISRLPPDASATLTASIWIYGLGLLCMLSASALYNLMAAGRLKAQFRRLDHAAIFVMIAGSYTPFALNAFPEFSGRLLLGIIWSLAIAGIVLKFVSVPYSGFLSGSLYIGAGWVILGFLPVLISSVAKPSLLFLLFGGIVYSAGALVHARGGFRFHNAIWHAMVLLGAALHFGAIALLL
jgi:hemolysin III